MQDPGTTDERARTEMDRLRLALSNARVVDPAFLEELKQLASAANPDAFGDVLSLFLIDSPPRFSNLVAGWRARDVEAMHVHAHALKGSAANLGAERMLLLLTTLDRDLKGGKLGLAMELMPLITLEFHAVMEFFRDYLRKHRAEMGR